MSRMERKRNRKLMQHHNKTDHIPMTLPTYNKGQKYPAPGIYQDTLMPHQVPMLQQPLPALPQPVPAYLNRPIPQVTNMTEPMTPMTLTTGPNQQITMANPSHIPLIMAQPIAMPTFPNRHNTIPVTVTAAIPDTFTLPNQNHAKPASQPELRCMTNVGIPIQGKANFCKFVNHVDMNTTATDLIFLTDMKLSVIQHITDQICLSDPLSRFVDACRLYKTQIKKTDSQEIYFLNDPYWKQTTQPSCKCNIVEIGPWQIQKTDFDYTANLSLQEIHSVMIGHSLREPVAVFVQRIKFHKERLKTKDIQFVGLTLRDKHQHTWPIPTPSNQNTALNAHDD